MNNALEQLLEKARERESDADFTARMARREHVDQYSQGFREGAAEEAGKFVELIEAAIKEQSK